MWFVLFANEVGLSSGRLSFGFIVVVILRAAARSLKVPTLVCLFAAAKINFVMLKGPCLHYLA